MEVATDGIGALERVTTRGGEAAGYWWAGWLSYDLGREIERLPDLGRDDLGLPPLALGRFEAWLEFDHARRIVTVHGGGDAGHLLEALGAAADTHAPAHAPVAGWHSSLPRPDYEAAVQRAIDYICAGDMFQVNLSQRLSTEWDGDAFALYARLRHESPAPFAALVRLGGADVISASPERFLHRRGNMIETRPIKGTRPRMTDAAADRRQALSLRSSAKDVAENVMIVDLARNDLGRIAEFGTVSVEELCGLESHPGVHHLVSTITARTRADVSASDVIRATFPPGSVTGAPKVRALEIIEELEPVRRGPYCGAVGWFGPGDELELSVAIRTMIAAQGALHLHVGGAVTADSDPAGEWQESMHKAARLLRAAGGAVETGREALPLAS